MPKGPQGQKRPADMNQLAKMIVDIASGEVPDRGDEGKDPNATALGRKGGKARAATMTAEQRAEAARKAAAGRWQTD